MANAYYRLLCIEILKGVEDISGVVRPARCQRRVSSATI